LLVSGSRAKAQVSFDAEAGAMPTLSDLPDKENVEVVTVSSFGGQAHLEATVALSEVMVDGQRYDWKPEGVDLSNLVDGNHTLSWHEGATTRQSQFETGPGPDFAIMLFPESSAVASAPPPAAQPQPPPQPTADSQAQQIYKLQNQAHEAYLKGQYAEPPGDNAIEYSNRVLQLNPGDDYVKQNILGRARDAEKMQINDALSKDDLSTARRKADVLVSLLPNDAGVQAVQKQVSDAEAVEAAKHRRTPDPAWSKRVLFENHPGNLTVIDHDLKFVSPGDPNGQTLLELPCSAISEIRENGRFHKKGFRVLTKSKKSYEFLSSDTTGKDVSSACKK
jgi:hypothetical protein